MQARRVAVAYSGGRDSTALLRATLTAARATGTEVLALHVHHGLNPKADDWLAACNAQCRRWARAGWPVKFEARRLIGAPARGDSVEAWARKARYRALRDMALAHGTHLILLAHHRRDQAETLMLQALRGAGVAGLAGMPRLIEREGITWARPWLDTPREAIDAYVRRLRLRHIDDDSNADPRYARNRLRLQVWPALSAAFPAAEASLADASNWAQQALVCMNEIAALDLDVIANSNGLDIAAWRSLSGARQGNALRAWLKSQSGVPANANLVQRLLAEIALRQSARWPMAGGELRSYRGRLHFEVSAGPSATPGSHDREITLSVLRAGSHALPGWGGVLNVMQVEEGGVPLAWLAHLSLRARGGAERFQSGLGRPPRSLKKQFQAAGLPAWQREGPLVYAGGQLVFVPGLGLDARVIGLPGQPQVTMDWRPWPRP